MRRGHWDWCIRRGRPNHWRAGRSARWSRCRSISRSRSRSARRTPPRRAGPEIVPSGDTSTRGISVTEGCHALVSLGSAVVFPVNIHSVTISATVRSSARRIRCVLRRCCRRRRRFRCHRSSRSSSVSTWNSKWIRTRTIHAAWNRRLKISAAIVSNNTANSYAVTATPSSTRRRAGGSFGRCCRRRTTRSVRSS